MFRAQITILNFLLSRGLRVDGTLPVAGYKRLQQDFLCDFYLPRDQLQLFRGLHYNSISTSPHKGGCIQRVTHITVEKVTHITLLVWHLRRKCLQFEENKTCLQYLDVLCLTYHRFIYFDAFNSEKFANYNCRYEKTHSEGDPHNAELRRTQRLI